MYFMKSPFSYGMCMCCLSVGSVGMFSYVYTVYVLFYGTVRNIIFHSMCVVKNIKIWGLLVRLCSYYVFIYKVYHIRESINCSVIRKPFQLQSKTKEWQKVKKDFMTDYILVKVSQTEVLVLLKLWQVSSLDANIRHLTHPPLMFIYVQCRVYFWELPVGSASCLELVTLN